MRNTIVIVCALAILVGAGPAWGLVDGETHSLLHNECSLWCEVDECQCSCVASLPLDHRVDFICGENVGHIQIRFLDVIQNMPYFRIDGRSRCSDMDNNFPLSFYLILLIINSITRLKKPHLKLYKVLS